MHIIYIAMFEYIFLCQNLCFKFFLL